MSNWFETLPGLHWQLWLQLGQGVADPSHAAHFPTFATVSPDGLPQARTVVLRAADATTGTVEVYTDLHSDKVRSLRKNPFAALHIWAPLLDLQLRLQADVTILTGAQVADRWHKVPDPSRQSYGVVPSPGTPIVDPLAYEKTPDQSTFAVLKCEVFAIDVVHLGAQHRRACFQRSDAWEGQWLAP